MKQVLLACFLLGSIFSSNANNDIPYVSDVFFQQNGAYIVVHYQVSEGPETQRLLVNLAFNINGKIIKPEVKSLEGHVGGVKMDGKEKQITWDTHKTKQLNLTGQITPIVTYEVLEFDQPAAKVIDFSPSGIGALVLPTIGHKKMGRKSTVNQVLSLGQIVGVTTGIGALLYSKSLYKKYEESTFAGNGATIETKYDRSEGMRKLGNGLLFVGAGCWVTNTLYLVFRGKTNKQKLEDFDRKYNWGVELTEDAVMGKVQWTIN